MQTVEKALSLLSYFSVQQPEASLSDLTVYSKFDKSTVRKCLLALINNRLIDQDHVTKRYRIGPGVLHLASIREASQPIKQIAQSRLESLARESGETAHLSLYHEGKLRNYLVVESRQTNRISFAVGEESPLHATSTGMAVLANLSETQRDDVLNGQLGAFTRNTKTDKESIERELKKSKRRGYFVNNDAYEEGISSIGAPIFDHTAGVIGALAVACPSIRFNKEKQQIWGALVKDAANSISQQLGDIRATH